MNLSTGPHLSHGWLFREHKATLGFSACTTLTEMFCSISSSTSSAPQQQPEQKENTGEVYVGLRKKEYPHHKWPALTVRHNVMKLFSRDLHSEEMAVIHQLAKKYGSVGDFTKEETRV